MYGIKSNHVRERLDLLFGKLNGETRESLVELWAIVSDIQLWMSDQEEKRRNTSMENENLMNGPDQPSPSSPRPLPKPTIGRIVIYHFASHEFNFNNQQNAAPAIITAVWSETCVNLKVLTDSVHDLWKTSASLGDGPAQWSWPPRV